MRSPATPPAAPLTGAALRAAALAVVARIEAQQAAAPCPACHLAQPLTPAQQQFEPSTDPARWQGFI